MIDYVKITSLLSMCLFFFEVQLTYTIILVSGVQHNDSIFVYIAKCLPQ